MATKSYLSPGTYVSEKDLTFTVEALGVTTLGLVGETLKGPAFQPLFIRNYDEYKTLFGGTSPAKFRNTQIPQYELPYIAKSYLTQSNQLYVTRILGLSGYDKGVAYVLKTIGGVDVSTVAKTTQTTTTVRFEYDVVPTGTTVPQYVVNNTVTSTLAQYIETATGIAQENFDEGFATFFQKLNYTTKDWHKGNILYWGGISSHDLQAFVTGSTIVTGNNSPATVDAYELGTGVPSNDRLNDVVQKHFVYNNSTNVFNGKTFALFVSPTGTNGPNKITGDVTILVVNQTAETIAKGHNKLVATLRSRGQYVTDTLSFKVRTVGLSNTSDVGVDPLASFLITGTTSNGSFSHNVSLDKKKKNYVKSVFGTTTSDKETNLYVEEIYDSFLSKAIKEGTIHGIYSQLVTVNTWDHFNFQYQSPVTPFFVSEVRGSAVQRLFRAVSISDGSNANTQIKISIANIDLNRKVFDLYVRSFNDSDKAPVILERYVNCSMNESDANYVGKKVGTIDNKYDLKSSFIILEMANNSPSDAVPAGFEGYEFRSATGLVVPDIHFKTKYYKAGDVIVDPAIGSPIISVGDKVRKCYLGFTDLEYGFDADLLEFKGKISVDGENTYNQGEDYATNTKGFHMDVNAPSEFTTGVATFSDALEISADETHPYNDLRTRKFTAFMAGGFDGWDEFRDSRTNGDEYRVGRTAFNRAGFDIFSSVEYDEVLGTSDYYAFLYGTKTFQNPEATVINILATPGIDVLNNTELVRDVIEIVEEKRKDCIYIPTLPDMKLISNVSPANTEDWLYPKDIVNELEDREIDSNYTAVYYPWIQVADVENSANLFIPPTAEVLRNMAYTDNIAHPWYATAGYNRGLVNTRKARLAVDQEDRDILYDGRINPLLTQTDVGVVIWGNRNLQIKDSPMNRINIRRLLLQAKKLIVQVANRLLFDPNDARVRNEFLSQVNPILDNIRKERGLVDFRVVLSPENAEDVDRNTMKGKIFIKPTPTLEFIELEFNVAPNNVSFDNI